MHGNPRMAGHRKLVMETTQTPTIEDVLTDLPPVLASRVAAEDDAVGAHFFLDRVPQPLKRLDVIPPPTAERPLGIGE